MFLSPTWTTRALRLTAQLHDTQNSFLFSLSGSHCVTRDPFVSCCSSSLDIQSLCKPSRSPSEPIHLPTPEKTYLALVHLTATSHSTVKALRQNPRHSSLQGKRSQWHLPLIICSVPARVAIRSLFAVLGRQLHIMAQDTICGKYMCNSFNLGLAFAVPLSRTLHSHSCRGSQLGRHPS